MIMRHQKTFSIGTFLALTFVGVLLTIFSNAFNGHNGLEFSDELFNKLSKGSSNFHHEMEEVIKPVMGKQVSVTVEMPDADKATAAAKVLGIGGLQATAKGKELTYSGDLGKALKVVSDDSEILYYNDTEKKLSAKYGMKETDAMELWWTVLNKSIKELQKAKKVDEANAVHEIKAKSIEPAYNFYGIEPQKVSDKALLVLGLLTFYVIYTMWWGYAIFYLFDGLGLSMKKAKVKQEV